MHPPRASRRGCQLPRPATIAAPGARSGKLATCAEARRAGGRWRRGPPCPARWRPSPGGAGAGEPRPPARQEAERAGPGAGAARGDTEGSLHEETQPWYYQQVYARYWKHYNQAMHWMYKHKNAYRKAMESFYHLSWSPPETFPTSRYSDWDGGNPSNADSYSPYAPNSRMRYPSWSQQYPGAHYRSRVSQEMRRDSEMENDSESEEEIECDLSNMEITEELRQYFAQTERHRQELRKQQQLEAEHQEMYVEADHDLHLTTRRSVQPPAERPGERRMAEMKKLYGVGAAKIQAMETAMQLAFDRNCDKKQPKYWPVIPLKL